MRYIHLSSVNPHPAHTFTVGRVAWFMPRPSRYTPTICIRSYDQPWSDHDGTTRTEKQNDLEKVLLEETRNMMEFTGFAQGLGVQLLIQRRHREARIGEEGSCFIPPRVGNLLAYRCTSFRAGCRTQFNLVYSKGGFRSCGFRTGGFRSWPPATCSLSTKRSFDHHGKGNGNFV